MMHGFPFVTDKIHVVTNCPSISFSRAVMVTLLNMPLTFFVRVTSHGCARDKVGIGIIAIGDPAWSDNAAIPPVRPLSIPMYIILLGSSSVVSKTTSTHGLMIGFHRGIQP
jgi:hypothetical protein